MSRTIYIGRECFHVEGEKHFANILEEKLGPDAAELFRDCLEEAKDDGYRNGYKDGKAWNADMYDEDDDY